MVVAVVTLAGWAGHAADIASALPFQFEPTLMHSIDAEVLQSTDLSPQNNNGRTQTTVRFRFASPYQGQMIAANISFGQLEENQYVQENFGENKSNEFVFLYMFTYRFFVPLTTNLGIIRREDIFFDGNGFHLGHHLLFGGTAAHLPPSSADSGDDRRGRADASASDWGGSIGVAFDFMRNSSLRQLSASYAAVGVDLSGFSDTLASNVRYGLQGSMWHRWRRVSFSHLVEAYETPFFNIPSTVYERLGSPILEYDYTGRVVLLPFGRARSGGVTDLAPYLTVGVGSVQTHVGFGFMVH